MLMKEEFLSKLRTYFGLNLYEVKIWTSLLARGIATAGELSDIANVPRSRSYDILESLEKKGFVIAKFGKPIKYMAISPEEVVERVKKHMQKQVDVRIKRLDDIDNTEIVDELSNLHKQGADFVEPSDRSGNLKGRHNIYDQLDNLIKAAEKSIVLMTTEQGLVRKIEGLGHLFAKLKKRGVDIKIAAPITETNKASAESIAASAEVRHTDIKGRFCIVDGRELVFMVMDDSEVHPTYDTAIWINTPFFAGVLQGLFELAWKKMKKVTVEKVNA